MFSKLHIRIIVGLGAILILFGITSQVIQQTSTVTCIQEVHQRMHHDLADTLVATWLTSEGPVLKKGRVAGLFKEILDANQMSDAQIHRYLMHQATWKMLDQLRTRMGVAPDRVPVDLSEVGNTVSCTLPILIDGMRKRGQLGVESVNMLIGFGVGLSWAGCLWRDTHG